MPDRSDPSPRQNTNAAGNRLYGDAGNSVQAGAIHGGVHITASPEHVGIPRQLPLATNGFVNRRAELARLDELLPSAQPSADRDQPDTVIISAIGGAPGIGKTALALHWARRVRHRFPDGDLYVNLRGHGPGSRLDAAAALESLLRTLGVPPDRIPVDLDGRAALFRSRVDGKHLLVLLDDALSAEQVRPLLPASPTCLVLVTSRSNLPGLAAREGARRMVLDTLTTGESLALLREQLGTARVEAEPAAAHTLVQHCARLPLALRVLAERLNELHGTPLHTVAEELAAEDDRLDGLGVADDELSDVRAVFTASYGSLPEDAARLFRSLGAHPGTEFGAASCAAAAGTPTGRTRRLLERLTGANMLQLLGHDRYRLHELLRVYAVERLLAEDPAAEETAIVGRLATWYLACARNAVRAVMPNFRFVPPPVRHPEPLGPGVRPPGFASDTAALAWFADERDTIVQTLRAALDHGLDDLAWRLPATVYPLFEYRWHWAEWREIHLIGLEAARAQGDRHGEARNLIGLADAEWSSGGTDTAVGRYETALEAAQEADDGWTQGFALRQLGALRWQRDRDPQAEARLWEAAHVFHQAGEQRGGGMALLSLAEYERDQGRTDAAEEHARAAIDLFTAAADTWTTAWAGCCLATVLTASGRLDEAAAEYDAAITVFHEGQNPEGEAVARLGAGRTHAAAGRRTHAQSQLGAALDILRSMEDPGADEVAAEIARLEQPQ